MKKEAKIFERVILFLLIIIMSINSFAAVISDNDGSAFITKSEFDSMKFEFRKQIDDYNSSIDNKIDGAIAQYLAGFGLAKTEEKNCLLYGEFKSARLFDDPLWNYHYQVPNIKINTKLVDVRPVSDSLIAVELHIKVQNYDFPITSFAADLTNYQIVNNRLTNVKVKLNGCREVHQNLSIYGVANFASLLDPGSLTGHDWWIAPANGGESVACESNDFYVDTFINSGYHQHRTGGVYGDYDSVYPDFFKNKHTILSQHFTGNIVKDECCWFSLNGNEEKILLNTKESPALFIGNNDVRNLRDTGEALDFWDDRYLDISGSGVKLVRFDSSWTRTAQKRDVAADKPNLRMGILNGIGYFAGKNIEAQVSEFEDKVTGITISDLNVASGFPLLIEKKDYSIEWTPKFDDTTKTYRVWLSYEPFDKNDASGLPSTVTDFVDINEKVPGQKYAEVSSGSKKLTWTMSKTSPVYMKWAEMSGGTEVAQGWLRFDGCNTYKCYLVD